MLKHFVIFCTSSVRSVSRFRQMFKYCGRSKETSECFRTCRSNCSSRSLHLHGIWWNIRKIHMKIVGQCDLTLPAPLTLSVAPNSKPSHRNWMPAHDPNAPIRHRSRQCDGHHSLSLCEPSAGSSSRSRAAFFLWYFSSSEWSAIFDVPCIQSSNYYSHRPHPGGEEKLILNWIVILLPPLTWLSSNCIGSLGMQSRCINAFNASNDNGHSLCVLCRSVDNNSAIFSGGIFLNACAHDKGIFSQWSST